MRVCRAIRIAWTLSSKHAGKFSLARFSALGSGVLLLGPGAHDWHCVTSSHRYEVKREKGVAFDERLQHPILAGFLLTASE